MTERILSGMYAPHRLDEGEEIPILRITDRRQPMVRYDGRVRVFDLSKKTHLAEYQKIIDQAAKGEVLISREEINFVPQRETYIVLLRWLIPFERLEEKDAT